MYSNIILKGTIGYNPMGWACIAIERAKSDKPMTPIMCEVWGYEHECGSMYRNEFTPTNDLENWKAAVKAYGGDPDQRYFKGKLIY
ncbi:MAG: hypothetical protein WC389_10395 [Lutibacter sp.]|jgi:hypothetical protein